MHQQTFGHSWLHSMPFISKYIFYFSPITLDFYQLQVALIHQPFLGHFNNEPTLNQTKLDFYQYNNVELLYFNKNHNFYIDLYQYTKWKLCLPSYVCQERRAVAITHESDIHLSIYLDNNVSEKG